MATVERPQSPVAARVTAAVVEYLQFGPATRNMVLRDIRGSNEAVSATLDELEMSGRVVRRGKFLRLVSPQER